MYLTLSCTQMFFKGLTLETNFWRNPSPTGEVSPEVSPVQSVFEGERGDDTETRQKSPHFRSQNIAVCVEREREREREREGRRIMQHSQFSFPLLSYTAFHSSSTSASIDIESNFYKANYMCQFSSLLGMPGSTIKTSSVTQRTLAVRVCVEFSSTPSTSCVYTRG